MDNGVTEVESLRVGSPRLNAGLGRMILRVNGRVKYYSHYIWWLNTGEWPNYDKGEVIHHKDGNTLNDSFNNLLLMTRGENNLFQRKKGGSKARKAKSYRTIEIDGKTKLYSHYIYFLNTNHWPVWPEVIHHIDGNSLNDDFENLKLTTFSEHRSLHMSGKNNPRWLGDSANALAKYERHRLYPDKYPPLTEAERQEYRAYHRNYKETWVVDKTKRRFQDGEQRND